LSRESRHHDKVRDLIGRLYSALSLEELFSRAKHSWQTFFHHSASVASISYRLAELYKSRQQKQRYEGLFEPPDVREVKYIEKYYGLSLEELSFLLGVVHDYVKLYGIDSKLGKEKARELLEKLLSDSLPTEEQKARTVEMLITAASAVEGVSAPELRNPVIEHISKHVSLADKLASAGSVSEAVQSVAKSEVEGLRIGYVMTSAPSLLQAKVSEELVGILKSYGWVPLAIYYDGLIAVGDERASTVPIREVVNALEKEVAKAFSVEEQVERLVAGLSKKRIAEIFSKLEQTQAKLVLGGDDPTNAYHDIIVRYLAGEPFHKLTEFKKGKRVLDPRTLATGIERGSKYFEEYLGTMLVSKESLISTLLSIRRSDDGRKRLFLLLSYMVAFASKDEEKVAEIVKRAFGIDLPRNIDKDILYSVVMAEVYRNLDNDDIIRRVVDAVFEVLNVRQETKYYVSRFVATSIKSNIIDTGLDAVDVMSGPVGYANYCRVCGSPLLSESIALIEYARTAKVRGGGGSEMWLHDDPPLASIEAIATSKESRIRFICPLCYYEATVLGEECEPPFLVIALHPAVAYDVWEWFKERAEHLKYSAHGVLIEEERRKLAEEYSNIVRRGFKVEPSREQSTSLGTYPGVLIVDTLGARIAIPLRADMSLKMKDVARALVLAPYAMSVAGGGQVGLVSNLSHAYNLGSEQLPVVLPHPLPFLYEIHRTFESVGVKAKAEGRDMTPDEYAVYNMSYITILEALYVYSIKVLAWYSGWKRKSGAGAEFGDYALDLLEHTSSIPYVPLALAAPPPSSLDPREGDEPLPYYGLISQKSQEVELRMSQVQKLVEGKEQPLIGKALYQHAATLKELNSDLSKTAVQKPLRRAIELIVDLAPLIGFEEARNLAREKFVEILETALGADLVARKKKIRGKDGKEVEVSYATILQSTLDDILEVIGSFIEKQVPSSKLSRFVETLLDAAYEKYKRVTD